MDPRIPIIIEDQRGTNPHPGVIATNPQTIPHGKLNIVDYFLTKYSKIIHVSPPAHAAIFVFMQAVAAISFDANAEPPLNPNHPNQIIEQPNKVYPLLRA